MIVLDAYAVIAYLRGEAVASAVEPLLRGPTILPAANSAEVIDQLVRVWGRDADDVEADLAILSSVGMTVAPVTAEAGVLAGRLRSRHYHRTRMAVSLADCVAAAIALIQSHPLATADPALAAMTRKEQGQVISLADSSGSLP